MAPGLLRMPWRSCWRPGECWRPPMAMGFSSKETKRRRRYSSRCRYWSHKENMSMNVSETFQCCQIQANSRQAGGQTITDSSQVADLARVGLSWEYRLARAFVSEVRRHSTPQPSRNHEAVTLGLQYVLSFSDRSRRVNRDIVPDGRSDIPSNPETENNSDHAVASAEAPGLPVGSGARRTAWRRRRRWHKDGGS